MSALYDKDQKQAAFYPCFSIAELSLTIEENFIISNSFHCEWMKF